MADKVLTAQKFEALCRELSADPAVDEILADIAKGSDKEAAAMAKDAQARRASLRAMGYLGRPHSPEAPV